MLLCSRYQHLILDEKGRHGIEKDELNGAYYRVFTAFAMVSFDPHRIFRYFITTSRAFH